MKTIIQYITIAAVLSVSLPAIAQLRYDRQTGIHIGTTETDPDYSINTKDIHKITMYGPGDGSYLSLDIYHTFSYIYGLGFNVYFYESDTSTYQDIRAYDIRQSANGEIYDSYTEPEDALEVLRQLRPVSYSFKNESRSRSLKADSAATHFGFIAQEVREVLPDDVDEDCEGNLSIRYATFIPVAVNSIKALSDKASRNEKRLAELEKSILK